MHVNLCAPALQTIPMVPHSSHSTAQSQAKGCRSKCALPNQAHGRSRSVKKVFTSSVKCLLLPETLSLFILARLPNMQEKLLNRYYCFCRELPVLINNTL
ncbi:hypothetical protein RRG08_043175 [Elysia crispata]|uniref:Uncharacterized protein n=1 Tax=Elysia crispata TaxID=231223 RepID=A0AAE0ZIM8_9GAST|nr:hypothetical protein RRG08_043175 [Elysia crispata]